MKNRIVVLLLCSAVLFGFVACKQKEQQKEVKPVQLRVNHVQSSMDPVHASLEVWAKNVNARSNNSLELIVYGNAELGNNIDSLEQASMGANIISIADPGAMADYVPDYGIMNGPFFVQNNDDLQRLYNTPWHKEMVEKAAAKGIRVIGMNWFFGPRHLISKRPIKSVQDLKGMRVRVPSVQMWVETFGSLGAVPTAIAWAEVYSALEQGVVDAAEAPLSTIFTSKLQETAKNLTLTSHFVGIVGAEMSQKIWETLTKEQQTILVEEFEKQGHIYSKGVIDSVEDFKNKLKAEGVTIIEVDTAPFAEASKATFTKFPEWTAGLYERVRASF